MMDKIRECGLGMGSNGLPPPLLTSLAGRIFMGHVFGLQSDISPAIVLKLYGPTCTHWALRN